MKCPKTRNALDAVIMHGCQHDSSFSKTHKRFCTWWTTQANEEEVDACTNMMTKQGRATQRAACFDHFKKFKCPSRKAAMKTPDQCSVIQDVKNMLPSASSASSPAAPSSRMASTSLKPSSSASASSSKSGAKPVTAKHITDALHAKDATGLASMCSALNARASSVLVRLPQHKKHSVCESKKCSPLDACTDLLDKYLQHTTGQEFASNLASSCKSIKEQTLKQAGNGNMLLGARKTADMVHEHPKYTMCDYLDIKKTFLQQSTGQECSPESQLAYTSFGV